MFKRALSFFILVIALTFSSAAFAESIKVAGSGGMISIVTDLAKAYMKKYPKDIIDVNQKSVEAKGGIVGAYKGALNIGMAARYLNDSEKGLGLEVIEFARVPAVIAVNPGKNTIKGISSKQVCDVYTGKIKNWKELGGPDAKIMVLTRPEHDSTAVAFKEGIKCFVGTTISPDAVIMPKAQDMFNGLTKNTFAIGFTDLAAVTESKGAIRALSLDGVTPSPESVVAGKWHVVKPYTLLVGKNKSSAVKRFINFIKTPEAQAIIKSHKAIPLNFKFN